MNLQSRHNPRCHINKPKSVHLGSPCYTSLPHKLTVSLLSLDMGSVDDVSELHVTPIFRVEVSWASQCSLATVLLAWTGHSSPRGYVGPNIYVGALTSLWLFLFAAQPEEFYLDELKKLEQRSHKCVEIRGEYVE
jgi:hypothetical protein